MDSGREGSQRTSRRKMHLGPCNWCWPRFVGVTVSIIDSSPLLRYVPSFAVQAVRVYPQPHCTLSVRAMTHIPDIASLFETALDKYKERAGTNLIENELSSKLKSCNTAESVIEVLQDQAQGFRNHSADGGRMISRFKQVVNVLFKLSTSPVLVELVGIVVRWSFFLHGYDATTLLCSLFRPQKQFSRQSASS